MKKMMMMADIISLHYDELQSMCRENDRIISDCKTDDDLLNDVCLTALKKFKNKKLSDREGFDYLRKNLLMAFKFKWKKIDNKIVHLEDFDYSNL